MTLLKRQNQKIMLNKRKNNMKFFILLITLIGAINISCQDGSFQFVAKMKVNETVMKKSKSQEESLTFLGDIVNAEGKIIYKIITLSSKTEASKVLHGQSKVLFLDPLSFTVIKTYNLGLPEELPIKLEGNTLFFNYTDENGKKAIFTNMIGTNPPQFLCVAPDDCY